MSILVRFLIFLSALFASVIAVSSELYFPPSSGDWETIPPGQVGWNAQALSDALDVAGERSSSARIPERRHNISDAKIGRY